MSNKQYEHSLIASVTITKAPADGEPGAPGQVGLSIIREDWVEGREYRNDTDVIADVRYLYWVHLPEDPADVWYVAKPAHNGVLSSDGNRPAGAASQYWDKANIQAPIYTPALFAKAITADQIDTDSITVNKLETVGQARISIHSGLIEIFGAISKNIEFGVNETGMAVMRYLNDAGELIYDLGPDGITKVPVIEEKWLPIRYIYLGTTIDEAVANDAAYKNNILTALTPTYYKYISKRVAGVVEDPANDGLVFTTASKGTKLSGYYCQALDIAPNPARQYLQWDVNETRQPITIDGMYSKSQLYDRSPLYFIDCMIYDAGKISSYTMIGWNGHV